MRVISPDYTINVGYENGVFCVITDEQAGEYAIGFRNIDLKGYLPMAIYKTKDEAIKVIKEMSTAAIKATNVNDVFVIKA